MTPDELIAALTARFPIKVWSYIATIFGDLSTDAGVEISGPVLSALTDRIGIRPEAMRVALHRLRKDNWLDVRKAGRISHYRLRAERQAETRAASARIFSPHIPGPRAWHVVLCESGQEIPGGDDLVLAKGVVLRPGSKPQTGGSCLMFDTHSGELPAWVRARFMTPGWDADCRDLSEMIARLDTATRGAPPARVIDRMTLRLLIVHNWRRLVLRNAFAVEQLQAEDWIGFKCRSQVIDLLSTLPRMSRDKIIPENMSGVC